uniref:Uncharacterized protein n=1 Tax=Arundo donax TaxID=35708 RepID=A0A0A9HE60_ARUDO
MLHLQVTFYRLLVFAHSCIYLADCTVQIGLSACKVFFLGDSIKNRM